MIQEDCTIDLLVGELDSGIFWLGKAGLLDTWAINRFE